MIEYFAGPFLGAAIGYCTNYIAVKMLFRPRREVRLFGRRLPLTPGAVPKGQPRLARAVGDVVSGYLVTEEDVAARILNAEAEEAVVERVMAALRQEIRQTMYKIVRTGEAYEQLVERVDELCTDKILEGVRRADIASFVREQGGAVVREQLKDSMLAMFLNDQMIASLLEPVGARFEEIVLAEGAAIVRPEVSRSLQELRDASPLSLLEQLEVGEDAVRAQVKRVYRESVHAVLPRLMERLDVATMIREKIEAMAPEQLEELVMAVMKRELKAIVNLGALIGFVLGLLNLLF